MIGINLGSGQRRFESPWWNFDIQVKLPDQVPDVQADGFRIPVKAESCDYVCCHHTLEHFGCNEGRGMLQECHRVLKSRGRLLVFVPNIPALMNGWLSGKIGDFILMANLYGAFQGSEADRHKWGFTEASLLKELRDSAPWLSVFAWKSYKKIQGALISWDWWILGVEAIKK